MFYVVTYSTDLRCKNTKIKKFNTKSSAIEFAKIDDGKFTHDDPEQARNYHHTFNRIYEYIGRLDKSYIEGIMKNATTTYPCTREDAIHNFLYEFAVEYEHFY